MNLSKTVDACDLCGRIQPLTFHHLIPRTVHSNKWFKKTFTREQMQAHVLYLCKLCHNGVHDIVPDEKALGKDYNTREKLLANPRIARHVEWVMKQK